MVDLPLPRVNVPAADAGVRPARPSDAPDVAAVQLAAWEQRYAGVLPDGALGPDQRTAMIEHWADSIAHPPTPRHAVLVATAGRLLVGYAVTAPVDADDDVTHDGHGASAGDIGEVADLEVNPDATRMGHGSRLLAAAVEHLRDRGCTEVAAWCDEADPVRRAFLESAGLAADGVRRRLDMGVGTPGIDELRLTARLDADDGAPGARPAPRLST